ncbi:MAG: amidohydrolase family protein [Coriobacteriia bacterium]|nr:amidohydrolase family protein [Coriobacteriia bacterium]
MLLCAKYVIPVSSPHIEDGAVLVRGDRIVAVGPRADLAAAHPEEEVRDYGLAVLMPGFVDLHTHLEYSVFRGAVDDMPYTQWKMQVVQKEGRLDSSDWRDSAVLGSMEAVESGITTVADITNTGNSVLAARAAGLSGVVYREVSTMDKSKIADRMEAAELDIAAWREAAGDAPIEIGIAPHSPYTCHPSLLQAAAELAIAKELPAAIHLAGSKDEYDFVRYGSSSLAQDFREQSGWRDVAWMPTGVSPVRYVLQWGLFSVPRLLAVHCVQVDEADCEVLASHDVAIAHCPRCNAKLGMGIAPLRLFFKYGLTVGIGTDSPASNNTIDPFDEMRIGLLLQRGMGGETDFFRFFTARTFVRLATIHGARALGLEHEIGSLEAGKRADVVAVDLSASHMVPTLDPYSALVHTANQENVAMTMVAGRVIYEAGEYLTVDVERTVARAQEIRAKLRG